LKLWKNTLIQFYDGEKMTVKCDICGEELSKRENEIYDEISDDNIPCFCSIAKRIKKLEDEGEK